MVEYNTDPRTYRVNTIGLTRVNTIGLTPRDYIVKISVTHRGLGFSVSEAKHPNIVLAKVDGDCIETYNKVIGLEALTVGVWDRCLRIEQERSKRK
ncbi:MAG: hypothetical protein AABW46_02070 [Nanoarchaeota archaeon]